MTEITTAEHKDLLGYDLVVGDHVVYATGYGSSKSMCVAEILEFTDWIQTRSFWPRNPETGELQKREVPRWKVLLQPKIYNDYRSDYDYRDGERIAKAPRTVRVERVENLVKVTLPIQTEPEQGEPRGTKGFGSSGR